MSRRRELVDCRDWRLVITGHSLGAGAAALVALYVHNFFPKCVHPHPRLSVTADTSLSITHVFHRWVKVHNAWGQSSERFPVR